MNWPRMILDGLMMAGWFCFAAGAGISFRPMMACNIYPKEIRKLVKPEPGHKKRVFIWPFFIMPILNAAIAGIVILIR